MTFYERLKVIRKHFGLSQAELAEKIGVKRNTVSKYESAILNPAGPVIELICREFGVSKQWLLEGTGEMLLQTHESMVDAAVKKYQLDELDRVILRMHLEMDPDGRAKLRRAAVELAAVLNANPDLLNILRGNPPTKEAEAKQVADRVYSEALSGGEKASESNARGWRWHCLNDDD